MFDMVFETNRLRIRPFLPTDFEDYFAYIMEPELQYMLGLNGVNDRASAMEAFQWLLDNREFLAIIQKETGRAIGHICIHPPAACFLQAPAFKGKAGCSLSFAIAKRMRRKGCMEEALRALIDHLFASGSADYIDCEYSTENIASQALQEKLGFAYWGKERADGMELITNVLSRADWNRR